MPYDIYVSKVYRKLAVLAHGSFGRREASLSADCCAPSIAGWSDAGALRMMAYLQKLKRLLLRRIWPSSQQRRAILVLGMHRSGTSALTGIVNALGAAAPKTLMENNYDNPTGFFESMSLMLAHDELLASAGSAWDDWRRFDPQASGPEVLRRHRKKIKALVRREFGDEQLIVIKDPRICRFVAFTSSILDELHIAPVAILPVRNPLEVALSLKRRNGFALPKSILLWLRHVLEAEFYSRNMPRVFLSYEGLLGDWRYHVDKVAQKTGLIWPNRSNGSEHKVDEFLAVDMRHEKVSLDELNSHPDVTPVVRETYNILTSLIVATESKEMHDRLDAIRTTFDDWCELFGGAAAAEKASIEQARWVGSEYTKPIESCPTS